MDIPPNAHTYWINIYCTCLNNLYTLCLKKEPYFSYRIIYSTCLNNFYTPWQPFLLQIITFISVLLYDAQACALATKSLPLCQSMHRNTIHLPPLPTCAHAAYALLTRQAPMHRSPSRPDSSPATADWPLPEAQQPASVPRWRPFEHAHSPSISECDTTELPVCIQWNTSNPDTIGPEESVPIWEVSLFQGLKSTQAQY